jgi:hypothetical protein
MAYMVMLVLREVEHLEAVLDAWRALQIEQVTFLESVCSLCNCEQQPHIPMRFLFEGAGSAQRQGSFTLFAVVPDDGILDECIAQAEDAVGGFDAPGHAALAAWPAPIVRGCLSPDPSGPTDA